MGGIKGRRGSNAPFDGDGRIILKAFPWRG